MVPPLGDERTGPFAHRLQTYEAIVQIGVTPPKSKYFIIVEYLKNVQYCKKILNWETQTYIQTNYFDTINPSKIKVTINRTYLEASNEKYVMITTADITISDKIKWTLISVRFSDNIINLQMCLLFVVLFKLDYIYVSIIICFALF